MYFCQILTDLNCVPTTPFLPHKTCIGMFNFFFLSFLSCSKSIVATIDLEHDKKDRKKKLNIPIQVLWGKKGVVGTQFKSVKIWQKYTNKKVYGAEINSDHFIPEESPKQTINHLKKFFLKNVKDNSK